MAKGLFEFVGKIGNYVIPAFGAILTFALATAGWEGARRLHLVSGFAIYTLLATYVGYLHRLAWLRKQNRESRNREEPSDLPAGAVALFLSLHLLLIFGLIAFVHDFVWAWKVDY